MKRVLPALTLVLLACLFFALRERPGLEPARAEGLSHVELITGGASREDKLPMLVAIHGLGDTPDGFLELFKELDVKARVIGPRAPDAWHGGFSWYPIDDAQAKPAVIRERAARVAELAGRLARERPTRGKPVVTGFSQGGVLSFALAAYHPQAIAASLPVAGKLEAGMPDALPFAGKLPVLAFHGRADPRITYAEGERTAEALKKAGRGSVLTGYEGVGHSIPPKMQRDYFAALREQLDAQAQK